MLIYFGYTSTKAFIIKFKTKLIVNVLWIPLHHFISQGDTYSGMITRKTSFGMTIPTDIDTFLNYKVMLIYFGYTSTKAFIINFKTKLIVNVLLICHSVCASHLDTYCRCLQWQILPTVRPSHLDNLQT